MGKSQYRGDDPFQKDGNRFRTHRHGKRTGQPLHWKMARMCLQSSWPGPREAGTLSSTLSDVTFSNMKQSWMHESVFAAPNPTKRGHVNIMAPPWSCFTLVVFPRCFPVELRCRVLQSQQPKVFGVLSCSGNPGGQGRNR